MRTMGLLLVFAVFVTATVFTQETLSDADVERLTTKVQSISASDLDSSLPAIRFDEWLRRELPQRMMIGWAVNAPGSGTADERSMPWVEVDVSKKGQPILAIYVAFRDEDGKPITPPRVRRIVLFKERDLVELKHLREIHFALNN